MGYCFLLYGCDFSYLVDFICEFNTFTNNFIANDQNRFSYFFCLQSLICFEQPRNHPFISDSEREFLQRKIEDYENERKKLPSTPWLAILKSPPVLTLALSTVSGKCYYNCALFWYITIFESLSSTGSIQLVILYH